VKHRPRVPGDVALVAKRESGYAPPMPDLSAALEARGIKAAIVDERVPPEPVVFVWGWRRAIEVLSKRPEAVVCCVERATFLPRDSAYATGWMGLNGLAEHPLVDDGGERLAERRWNHCVHPPRPPEGKGALLLGQTFNDAQIKHVLFDYSEWLVGVSERYRRAGRDVIFRPHPEQAKKDPRQYPGGLGRVVDPHNPLRDDLRHASTVVAFNSNGLVDALMFGVQDVRMYHEGSMLWPIAEPCGELGERRARVDLRQKLAERLAWTQWTTEDFKSGAWADVHLPIMARLLSGAAPRRWHEERLC